MVRRTWFTSETFIFQFMTALDCVNISIRGLMCTSTEVSDHIHLDLRYFYIFTAWEFIHSILKLQKLDFRNVRDNQFFCLEFLPRNVSAPSLPIPLLEISSVISWTDILAPGKQDPSLHVRFWFMALPWDKGRIFNWREVASCPLLLFSLK